MKKYSTEEIKDIALIGGALGSAQTALLIEKGIFTKEELRKKAAEIAGLTEKEIMKRVSNFST